MKMNFAIGTSFVINIKLDIMPLNISDHKYKTDFTSLNIICHKYEIGKMLRNIIYHKYKIGHHATELWWP
jgi:hypothetical protein